MRFGCDATVSKGQTKSQKCGQITEELGPIPFGCEAVQFRFLRKLQLCPILFFAFAFQIDNWFFQLCGIHADDFVCKCHCHNLQSAAVDQNENGKLSGVFHYRCYKLRFSFYLQQQDIDPVEMMTFVFQLEGSLLTVFAMCELGERVRMAFDEIRISIDQLKWYLIPKRARKMLPVILILSQEPIGFTIFGSILSNRITFKEVCFNPTKFNQMHNFATPDIQLIGFDECSRLALP